MSREREIAQSLYISGLSLSTTAEDLTNLFEKYGPVSDVYIPRDFNSQKSRGFAYVQYKSQQDAETAMDKIEFLEVGGKELRVEWAKGERKSAHQMRRRGPSSFRDYPPPRRADPYSYYPPPRRDDFYPRRDEYYGEPRRDAYYPEPRREYFRGEYPQQHRDIPRPSRSSRSPSSIPRDDRGPRRFSTSPPPPRERRNDDF